MIEKQSFPFPPLWALQHYEEQLCPAICLSTVKHCHVWGEQKPKAQLVKSWKLLSCPSGTWDFSTCQGVTGVSALNHVQPATPTQPIVRGTRYFVFYSRRSHSAFFPEQSNTPSLIWNIGQGRYCHPLRHDCILKTEIQHCSLWCCSLGPQQATNLATAAYSLCKCAGTSTH